MHCALLVDLASDLLLSLALRLGTVYHLSWDVLLWILPLGIVWRWSCSLELMRCLLTFSSGVSRSGLEGADWPFGRCLGWSRCTASQLAYSSQAFNPYYGCLLASWPTATIFYWDFYFSPPNLRGSLGRSSPNFAICSVVTVIYTIESEVWGSAPQKIWRPKDVKILARFRTLRFHREYLRMGTRYCRSENGVENCNQSPMCY